MANEQNKYAGISTLRTFLSQLKNLFITKTDANTALSGKADKAHNHDSDYDAKGSASAVQENLDVVSDALDAHTGDSNVHVTATNKSNWNSAHTHSTSTHARVDATKVADSTTNGNILINGTETNVYSHPNSGVTAGTYKSVTVNAQGHITSGSNPTTLSGYGITDAEAKGAASAALASAKEYADTVASGKADANHNHDSAYDTKGSANSALASAKTYADSAATTAANKVKNDLLNGAGTAYDTLKELGDLIDANQDAIDALETVASGKADKTHGHAISDISGLQSALDGKAASSHGTHVSYSSTAPVMDGAASVGSASTVARSDHKHPTDTSRAAKTDLDSHTGNTTVHITSTERSNWNAAKTHADSAHAPSNAQPNQNAFSNIKVGSTTIAADTTTDTLELVGSNVTITPDATNDKVTISVADASTGTKGIVQLTNSTASTSTTTAATPNSVKLVADLASTAKKNADAAQTRADSAYALAESKVDSLSDLGITATATELNYMDGVTSNVQTQLDGKSPTSHTHTNASLGQGLGYCSTQKSTTEKTVSLYNYNLVEGGVVTVEFVYGVPASATMNINGKGAKSIYYDGKAITQDVIKGGDFATFIYANSRYHLISVNRWHEDIVNLQATDTKVKQKPVSANANYPLLFAQNSQTAETDGFAYFDSGIYANPSTNKIYADISGTSTGVKGVTSGSFLVGNGTGNMVEKTPAEVLTYINGANADDVVYSDDTDEYTATTPLNADTLGGRPASEFATETFVQAKIAEAQLDGGGVDLSGYATKDELNALDASDVGAAPSGYGLGGSESPTVRAENLNSTKRNGWYRIVGKCIVTMSSGAKNNLENALLFVHNFDANSVVQKVIPYGSTAFITRKCYGGAWDAKWVPDLLEPYPVGAVYISVNSTSPASLFGGTWTQLKDRFLLGAGSSYSNGATGGASTVTLTTSQIPSHSHTIKGVNDDAAVTSQAASWPVRIYQDKVANWDVTASTIGSTGGGGSHNNMPPYLVVYMWKRTA